MHEWTLNGEWSMDGLGGWWTRSKKHYLTSEDFDFPACYDMPEDKMLSLTLRPEVCVGDALYALQTVSDDNVSQLKMTLYQLRATLVRLHTLFFFFFLLFS